MQNLKRHLFNPAEPQLLALFRIAFGLFMIYDILYFKDVEMVKMGMIEPDLLFKYDGFSWIKPFSEPVMEGLLTLAMVAAATFALGLYSQVSVAIFWLIFTFFFLQDKAFYNNHLYLFSLLSFVMIFMRTDSALSLRNLIRGRPTKAVPQWNYDLLKFHFLIVYFYGGIEKLTYDWIIQFEPMRSVLQNSSVGLPDFMVSEVSVAFFAYGGLIFDLLIGFLLWNARTRNASVAFVVFFNLMNHLLFSDIGSFPFIMIVSTIIFYSPQQILDLLRKIGFRIQSVTGSAESAITDGWKLTIGLLSIYVALQVLVPLKCYALPGNRDWIGTGNRFCWHMKVQSRTINHMEFAIMDPKYDQPIPVDATTFINTQQAVYLSQDHAMLAQFCRFIKQEAERRGMKNIRVLADIEVAFNGRPAQYFVDPKMDMGSVEIPLVAVPDYVIDLEDYPEN